jgi:hypothetical protein
MVLGSSAYLRAAPAKATGAQEAGVANKNGKATTADVQQLREKLQVMATGLDGLLNSKDGTLSKLKVAPALQSFLKQLRTTLSDTKDMKDTAKAMKSLTDAQAGIAVLVKDMTAQQEAIMKEDEEQKESLLLGVLMTKQKEPFDKQLEILKSSDFASLPVVKALLEKHDDKTPLFSQVGGWLDSKGKHVKAQTPEDQRKAVLANVQTVAASLEKRVKVLETSEKEGEARHSKVMKELARKEKTASKTEVAHLKRIAKREERQFKKWYAMDHRDLTSMREAVDAVKRGDMKKLAKVQEAIKASLKQMQSQSGNFLHLLQLGHRVLRKDCPFCAAQCLDKCHSGGGSYASCLTQCADAGKGF